MVAIQNTQVVKVLLRKQYHKTQERLIKSGADSEGLTLASPLVRPGSGWLHQSPLEESDLLVATVNNGNNGNNTDGEVGVAAELDAQREEDMYVMGGSNSGRESKSKPPGGSFVNAVLASSKRPALLLVCAFCLLLYHSKLPVSLFQQAIFADNATDAITNLDLHLISQSVPNLTLHYV